MDTKHTPGPWTVESYTPGFDQDGDAFESQMRVITRTCEVASGIQCEEDARLIAAAPELLQALYMTQRQLKKLSFKDGEISAALEAAYRAISKAKRES